MISNMPPFETLDHIPDVPIVILSGTIDAAEIALQVTMHVIENSKKMCCASLSQHDMFTSLSIDS